MRGVTGIPQRLLGEDEHVAMTLRPHWKELFGPTILLLVLSPLASFVAAKVPDGSAQKWLRLAVLVVAVLIVARWTVWPFLRWLTTSYVVTDRRIITRIGVFAGSRSRHAAVADQRRELRPREHLSSGSSAAAPWSSSRPASEGSSSCATCPTSRRRSATSTGSRRRTRPAAVVTTTAPLITTTTTGAGSA